MAKIDKNSAAYKAARAASDAKTARRKLRFDRFFWKAGDVLTLGALQRARDTKTALKKEELAIEGLNLQADQAVEQRVIEKSATARNIDIANREMAVGAREISEQSRAGAIEKFQAESAGEASLGVSGMSTGSSPYLALETSITEASRKISSWFSGANEDLSIASTRAAGSVDIANYNERSSIKNESLLRRGIAMDRQQLDNEWADYGLNTALDITSGLLQSGLALYSLGSSASAFGTMAKQGGLSLGGAMKNVASATLKNPASIFQLGGAMKYGQWTGDMGPLKGLFASGGLYGD
jgi:hypothetical protein